MANNKFQIISKIQKFDTEYGVLITYFLFRSINPITLLETFLPEVFSMPSNPGVLFISKTNGPFFDCRISTPQKPKFIAFAAFMAIFSSVGESEIVSEVPPRCRLLRKSPLLHLRFIAATTTPSTTMARMSAPFASSIYSWSRNFTPAAFKVSIVASAFCGLSVK